MKVIKFGGDFNINQSIWSLREQEVFTDVMIICKDGNVHAHRAMLAANYSPFKAIFESGNDNEVILAKDFTQVEILNDIMMLYFVQRSTDLECFSLIGKPASTVDIILTSAVKVERPDDISFEDEHVPKRKRIKEEDLDDMFEEDFDDPDYEPEKINVTVKSVETKKRRAKEVAPPDFNRCIEIPPDPAAYVQNSRWATGEQPGCLQCGLVFESYEDQEIHVQKHLSDVSRDFPKIIRCELCITRKVCTKYESYEKHLKKCHKRIKCPRCYLILANMKHVCKPSPFSCKLCHKNIESEEEWMVHQRNKHYTFNCIYCNKFFISKDEQEKHQETCLKQLNPKLKSIDNNLEDVQGEAFYCDYCDAVTSSVQLLLCHLKIKHFEGRKCLICNMIINTTGMTHVWIHLKEEYWRYKCRFCDRRFISKTKKREHENSAHTGDRPLKCKYCNAHFALSSHRAKHQRFCKSNPDRQQPSPVLRQAKPMVYPNPLVAHHQMIGDMEKSEKKFQQNGPQDSQPMHAPSHPDVNSQIMALLGKK